MAIIKTISDLLWGMPLIVLILLAGIIFTVGSKFFQIAHLKHKWNIRNKGSQYYKRARS